MEEIGVGIVNSQAEAIKSIDYPAHVGGKIWTVGPKVGVDDRGYDIYQLSNEGTVLEVPANRIVFMKHFIERYAVSG